MIEPTIGAVDPAAAPSDEGTDGAPAGGCASAGVVSPDVRPRVRARREATQRVLIGATEALLAERSFAEVTVEDVMTIAGLTRTAFYRYFPDLEALLLAALAEIRDELALAAAVWLGADPADAEAGLVPAATRLAEVYRRHGRMLLAFAEAAAVGGRVRIAYHDAVEAFVEPVHSRLDGLAGGERPHSGETARALVWMMERYFLETYGRGRDVPPAVAGTVVADILRAVLGGPTAA